VQIIGNVIELDRMVLFWLHFEWIMNENMPVLGVFNETNHNGREFSLEINHLKHSIKRLKRRNSKRRLFFN
jgi:hypothetical protein